MMNYNYNWSRNEEITQERVIRLRTNIAFIYLLDFVAEINADIPLFTQPKPHNMMSYQKFRYGYRQMT